jgi:hypothetical protein
VYRAILCLLCTPTMALESNTEIYKAADSTNRPHYVRKKANSWTRFNATLHLCFFMKALAIVIVGGAAKIAAAGIFGVLTLLRLYTRPKGRTKKNKNCLPEYPRRSCLERRRERATAPLQRRKCRKIKAECMKRANLIPFEL